MNVRFDGVYQEITEDYSVIYIRFYKNGKVLQASTIDDPEKSAEYLVPSNCGNGYVTEGSYQIESDIISFTTSDKECSIAFKGVIKNNQLHLNLKSSLSDKHHDLIFKFIEIENLIDRWDEPLPDRTGKILNYNGEWEEQYIRFDKLEDNEAIKKYPLGKFGEMILIYEKSDAELIKNLDKNWVKLESKVVKNLEEMVINSERLGHLKVKYFQATGHTKEYDENVFHGTDSNIMLSFHLLTNPDDWDFFIQDDEIVHCQPVY